MYSYIQFQAYLWTERTEGEEEEEELSRIDSIETYTKEYLFAFVVM